MFPLRVVVDTNVLVSGILNPLGPPRRILEFILSHAADLFISAEVFMEFQEVLQRPRNG